MTGREDLFEESMRLGHSAAWELDWEKAIEYYRKALAESPDDPSALTSLGLALLETEHYKEALASYHKASKLEPEDPIPVEKCAEIFEYLGQIEEALEQRDSAADRYVRQRNLEKAIANWSHSARLAPGNLAARSRLALTYERLGRRKESIQEYLAVASILQKAGKQDRAIEAVQRALMLIPGDPDGAMALRLLTVTGAPSHSIWGGPNRRTTRRATEDLLQQQSTREVPKSQRRQEELVLKGKASPRQGLAFAGRCAMPGGATSRWRNASPGCRALARRPGCKRMLWVRSASEDASLLVRHHRTGVPSEERQS